MFNALLFRKRQIAIERAATIVGAIKNPAAKPTRRFEADDLRSAPAGMAVDGAGELITRTSPASYSFPSAISQWSKF